MAEHAGSWIVFDNDFHCTAKSARGFTKDDMRWFLDAARRALSSSTQWASAASGKRRAAVGVWGGKPQPSGPAPATQYHSQNKEKSLFNTKIQRQVLRNFGAASGRSTRKLSYTPRGSSTQWCAANVGGDANFCVDRPEAVEKLRENTTGMQDNRCAPVGGQFQQNKAGLGVTGDGNAQKGQEIEKISGRHLPSNAGLPYMVILM
ncbi:hypothetical protein R3P38DRAFT_2804528 [Favolaschia claudopus]|uniref:Uncharacterized protein n=1 Tax=Favolaschia claudopus TaxID=2862362 RepID=A0AAV9ZQW6_9AGAR